VGLAQHNETITAIYSKIMEMQDTAPGTIRADWTGGFADILLGDIIPWGIWGGWQLILLHDEWAGYKQIGPFGGDIDSDG
jgi:hypothetical protein